MKELHDKYGVVVTCYVYYENDDETFDLSMFNKTYEEFYYNNDWLRFGFHTIRGDVSYEEGEIVHDYIKTINELERMVGSDSIDNVVRLQKFQGSGAGITALRKIDHEPIIGLLTADDNRLSYYLDEMSSKYIYCHDELYDAEYDIYLISTDVRVENIENIQQKVAEFDAAAWNNQMGDLVIFTHEWTLNMDVKTKVEKLCQYAVENNYQFKFFEDVL